MTDRVWIKPGIDMSMPLSQCPSTGYWDETDFGILSTHAPEQCADRDYGCAIHNRPSDHPLADAPLVWRNDTGVLERICEHGVGHPDHDSALYNEETGNRHLNVHGCDGCCLLAIREDDSEIPVSPTPE